MISKQLIKTQKCPLCKSKEFKFHSYSSPNLYSEFLSKFFYMDEEKLIKRIFNIKCKKCTLIMKNYWFKDTVLKKLFQILVPVHPKGFDLISQNFKKKDLVSNIRKLSKYKSNSISYNKSLRSSLSIINSMKYKKKFNNIKKELNKKNLNYYQLGLIANNIKKNNFLPEKYSRFTGYNNLDLWKLISKKVKFKNYFEIGCPAWGLTSIAKSKKIKTFFIKKNEPNFWNCFSSKNKCSKNLKKNKIKIKNLQELTNSSNLIGMIEYIDHLNKPLDLLSCLKKKSNSIFIITDDIEKKNLPIQHFTGWNLKSLKYMAKKMKMNFFSDRNFFSKKKMIISIFSN